jgi:hypothetical protein
MVFQQVVHRFLAAWIVAIAFVPFASGAEWAQKLFKETKHDFGTVSRNAKTEYAFVLENCFEEDVHIASVRSSCGCTKPIITKNTLKAWEKGEIVAQFNTKSFLGAKSAAITVVIDRPYYAEVTLLVSGKIRSDIVVEPGEISFGDVDIGSTKTVDLKISYAGRRDWAIQDVRGDTSHLEVRLDPATRHGNMTNYRMRITLKESAPAGDFMEGITVVTNDSNEGMFTLPVNARVVPPVNITPKLVSVGDVKSGQQVQQKLMVRAKKPFSIVSVECEDPRFSFSIPPGEKPLHLIPMTFTGELLGDERSIKQEIVVKTSLGEQITLETTVAGRMVD